MPILPPISHTNILVPLTYTEKSLIDGTPYYVSPLPLRGEELAGTDLSLDYGPWWRPINDKGILFGNCQFYYEDDFLGGWNVWPFICDLDGDRKVEILPNPYSKAWYVENDINYFWGQTVCVTETGIAWVIWGDDTDEDWYEKHYLWIDGEYREIIRPDLGFDYSYLYPLGWTHDGNFYVSADQYPLPSIYYIWNPLTDVYTPANYPLFPGLLPTEVHDQYMFGRTGINHPDPNKRFIYNIETTEYLQHETYPADEDCAIFVTDDLITGIQKLHPLFPTKWGTFYYDMTVTPMVSTWGDFYSGENHILGFYTIRCKYNGQYRGLAREIDAPVFLPNYLQYVKIGEEDIPPSGDGEEEDIRGNGMKRHYWQYLIDSAGNSIPGARIHVFLADTNNYANIQLTEMATTYVTSEFAEIISDVNGYFHFWVSDLETSSLYGYDISQKFDITFSKTGLTTGMIEDVQIVWDASGGKIKIDENDTLGYLINKLIAGNFISITPSGTSALVISLSGNPSPDTYKVKVDAADTEDYLESKLVAGDNITITPGSSNISISSEASTFFTFETSGLTLSPSTTADFTLSNFINRGLCYYLQIEETGGLVTGTYDILLFNSSSFTNEASGWNYKAEGIDPTTLYLDAEPFFLRDLDENSKLYIRLINDDSGGNNATYVITLTCGKFA